MRTFTTAAVLSLSAFACSSTTSGGGASSGSGSNRVALDAVAFCNKAVGECKQPITQQQCEQTFGVLRVSPDCPPLLDTATCQDIASTSSTFNDTCFPDCTSPNTQTCNGDGTITLCSSAKQTLVADCAATCQSIGGGKPYSGTCGKSFQGQTADEDKCWCQ